MKKNSLLLDNNRKAIKDYLYSRMTSNKIFRENFNKVFKLPYISKYFSYAKKKLKNLFEKCCNDISIKIIFAPFEKGTFFSFETD